MVLTTHVGDHTSIEVTIADSLFTPIAVNIGPLHIDLPFERALRLRDELSRQISLYSEADRKPVHGPARKLAEFNETAWKELFGDGAL